MTPGRYEGTPPDSSTANFTNYATGLLDPGNPAISGVRNVSAANCDALPSTLFRQASANLVAALRGCRYHTRPIFPDGAARPSMAATAMSSYNTSEFKSGLKILMDGDPCSIVENEFVKPGKGQAFSRVRIRNLRTNRVIERTFKSGETVEAADVLDVDMQYLYSDGIFWHFMQQESFEQYTANKTAVGEAAQWLKDGTVCIITLWNGQPLTVTPPAHVELVIVETDPGMRGDTVTGGTKVAKLETGAVVKVPLFLNTGEAIRVDTRSGEYIARAR